MFLKSESFKVYLTECIATFGMVFCGTGAIIINQETNGAITHLGIAITFGLIVMCMIYAFGKISGAHMNPAVTIALSIAHLFPKAKIVPYLISQAIGAFIASLLLHLLFPLNNGLGATNPSGTELQSFLLEFILTAFLMLTILQLSNQSETSHLNGLIIGMLILLEALFAGPICGASMNPIRSISPAVVSGQVLHLWLYIIAPILGAMSAVFIFKFLKKN